MVKYSELGCSAVFGVKKESSGILCTKSRSGEEEILLCRPVPASPDKPCSICMSLLSVCSICTIRRTNVPRAESSGNSLRDPLGKKKKKQDEEIRGENEFSAGACHFPKKSVFLE